MLVYVLFIIVAIFVAVLLVVLYVDASSMKDEINKKIK